jgi:hypothetical protein
LANKRATRVPTEMTRVPTLSGVRFRLFHDKSDYAALAVLHSASMASDGVGLESSLIHDSDCCA